MFGFNNQSQDGDRIPDALHRFHSEILTRDIDVLIIAVGCNDLIRWDSPDEPMDISKGAREEYWTKLMLAAKKNIKEILVVNILPKNEAKYPSKGWFDRDLYETNKDVEEYNVYLKKLCQTHGVEFLESYDEWKAKDLNEYYYDTGHPTKKGHIFYAETVYNKLKQLGWA